jgi:hypothetical protein
MFDALTCVASMIKMVTDSVNEEKEERKYQEDQIPTGSGDGSDSSMDEKDNVGDGNSENENSGGEETNSDGEGEGEDSDGLNGNNTSAGRKGIGRKDNSGTDEYNNRKSEIDKRIEEQTIELKSFIPTMCKVQNYTDEYQDTCQLITKDALVYKDNAPIH